MSSLTVALSLFSLLLFAPLAMAADAKAEEEAKLPAALNFEMAKLDGKKKINLAKEYQGKVVLLVNVASRCGFTSQYKGLQTLHDKYADKGLVIVGVPCNQFGGQEPGSPQEIATFCSTNYGVEFDLLEKVNVKASKPDQAPLYAFLTSKETNPKFAGDIKWNFTKFLFNKQGEVIARYESMTKPDSKKVVAAIEAVLAQE